LNGCLAEVGPSGQGQLRPVVGAPAMAGPVRRADLRHPTAAVKRLAVFRSLPLCDGGRPSAAGHQRRVSGTQTPSRSRDRVTVQWRGLPAAIKP